MELTLTSEGVQALVENIKQFQDLDPADDDGYMLLMDRLRAVQMQCDDLLVEVGEREPLTEMEQTARTKNPFYRPLGISPTERLKP